MLPGDPLDVADPRAPGLIRERGMTLFDIMDHSREHDMVAREWVNGFRLTRKAADELHRVGCGREGDRRDLPLAPLHRDRHLHREGARSFRRRRGEAAGGGGPRRKGGSRGIRRRVHRPGDQPGLHRRHHHRWPSTSLSGRAGNGTAPGRNKRGHRHHVVQRGPDGDHLPRRGVPDGPLQGEPHRDERGTVGLGRRKYRP